jgi:hypothetical protein
MWPIGCPETSAINYYRTLRNIPEVRWSFLDWHYELSHFAETEYVRVSQNLTTNGDCVPKQRLLSSLCNGGQMQLVWYGNEIYKFLGDVLASDY